MIAVVSSTEWLVGWIIGASVVLVVAVVLITITLQVASIKGQILAIHGALTKARDNTQALWEVQTTNEVATDILVAAQEARKALGG